MSIVRLLLWNLFVFICVCVIFIPMIVIGILTWVIPEWIGKTRAKMPSEEKETSNAEVWVMCSHCGEKHRVIPGVEAPVYWCGNNLLCLKDGDDVEYEETKEESSSVFC